MYFSIIQPLLALESRGLKENNEYVLAREASG